MRGEVRVEVILTNARAVRALAYAAEVLMDVAEDMPWRDDVKKAVRAMRYAARHMDTRQEEP
jgi:hypothetical protein